MPTFLIVVSPFFPIFIPKWGASGKRAGFGCAAGLSFLVMLTCATVRQQWTYVRGLLSKSTRESSNDANQRRVIYNSVFTISVRSQKLDLLSAARFRKSNYEHSTLRKQKMLTSESTSTWRFATRIKRATNQKKISRCAQPWSAILAAPKTEVRVRVRCRTDGH